jgi:hypothetical protein
MNAIGNLNSGLQSLDDACKRHDRIVHANDRFAVGLGGVGHDGRRRGTMVQLIEVALALGKGQIAFLSIAERPRGTDWQITIADKFTAHPLRQFTKCHTHAEFPSSLNGGIRQIIANAGKLGQAELARRGVRW